MIDSDMDMEARKLKYGKDVFKTDAEFRRLQLEVNRLTDDQFERFITKHPEYFQIEKGEN